MSSSQLTLVRVDAEELCTQSIFICQVSFSHPKVSEWMKFEKLFQEYLKLTVICNMTVYQLVEPFENMLVARGTYE